MKPKIYKNIYVMTDASTAIGRNLMMGISIYRRHVEDWQIHWANEYTDTAVSFSKYPIHAAIGKLYSPDWVDFLIKNKIPAINTYGHKTSIQLPSVISNNYEIGVMAADYLVKHFFKRFAFIGSQAMEFSQQREAGFVNTLQKHGFESTHIDYKQAFKTGLYDFIKSHDKVPAIFCASDFFARRILEFLYKKKLSSPQHFGMLGVDNCTIESHMSPIAISSIDPDFMKVGYEAARTMHRLLEGKSIEDHQEIAPKCIVRKATTSLFEADPLLNSCIHYIQTHACNRMSIDMMAEQLGYSRRTIERRFKSVLNCKVLDYIKLIQFDEAREQVRSSGLPIYAIAGLIGYADHRHFTRDFKKHVGMSPSEYRKSLHALSNQIHET